MAKRNSQLTELIIVAQDDYLTIVDTSAGQSKRISVKNLTGAPDFTWTATGEAWTFSSFNSTTRIGVITVPSDATQKYAKGMWIRIAQSTGGTKWAKITAVTSTTISANFFYNQTLNNEAITTPVYSSLAQPVGAPGLPLVSTDANGWKVFDFGTYHEWTKYFTRGINQAGSTWTNATPENLPAMMSSVGTNIPTTSAQSGDAAITANVGSSPGDTGIQVQHTNQYGGTVATTIYMYARILEA